MHHQCNKGWVHKMDCSTARLFVTGFPVLKSVNLPVLGCLPGLSPLSHWESADVHADFSLVPT